MATRSLLSLSTFTLVLALAGACSNSSSNAGGQSSSSGGTTAGGYSGSAQPAAKNGLPTKPAVGSNGNSSSGAAAPAAGGSQAAPAPAAAPSCYKSDKATCAAEYRVFQLTNAFRAQNGLPAFTFSEDISFVARGWSTSQAQSGTISHDGWPDARVQTYAKEFPGVGFATNAENVAMMGGASGDVAQQFVTMWINSPGHRANMLGQSAVLGVGIVCTQDGSCYATQIFGFEGASVQTQ